MASLGLCIKTVIGLLALASAVHSACVDDETTTTPPKPQYHCRSMYDTDALFEYPPDGCDSAVCDPQIRNATCTDIVHYDYVYCGCVFCNYDRVSGLCVGQCADRNVGSCLNKVEKPTSDDDCECYTCQNLYAYNPHYGYNTIVGCNGTCLASGKQCQLVVLPDLNPIGRLNCICWDQSSQYEPYSGNPLDFGFDPNPSTHVTQVTPPPFDFSTTDYTTNQQQINE
jgi:hypothetical protein